MRIAMMQMAMTEDMERNLQVSYEAVKEAAGVDLLFFPEVQHMPFCRSTRQTSCRIICWTLMTRG